MRPRGAIAALALLLSACGLRRPPVPIDRSQDQRIQADVVARLAAEPALAGTSIRVDVDGRVVMLHGSVQGIGAWQCAITNAELVPGVQSVVDYLVLERGEATLEDVFLEVVGAGRSQNARSAGDLDG